MHMPITKDSSESYFATYDLGLAAALIASGYILAHLDKSNPKRAQFVFKRTYGVEEVVERFWTMEFQVDALGYFNAIKLLKNRLYSN